MSQNEIAIMVQGLKKSYKNIPVLKGLDLQVKTGSIFELLVSNSAGKTTIVKILTKLMKHDSGNVTVNGFDVASKPSNVRQLISLTGQFAAVDEVLTGQKNIIMIAKLWHLSNPRQVANDLLKRSVWPMPPTAVGIIFICETPVTRYTFRLCSVYTLISCDQGGFSKQRT